MRVKRTEIVTLMELFEYAENNNIENTTVYTHGKDKLMVEVNGEGFKLFDSSSLRFDDEFTLEINHPLTKTTNLREFGWLYYTYRDYSGAALQSTNDKNIDAILGLGKNDIGSIYLLDKKDAKMILVWDADHGIPEDGVIRGGIV